MTSTFSIQSYWYILESTLMRKAEIPHFENVCIMSSSKPVDYYSLFREKKKNISHGGEITKINEWSHFLLPLFPAFSWQSNADSATKLHKQDDDNSSKQFEWVRDSNLLHYKYLQDVLKNVL